MIKLTLKKSFDDTVLVFFCRIGNLCLQRIRMRSIFIPFKYKVLNWGNNGITLSVCPSIFPSILSSIFPSVDMILCGPVFKNSTWILLNICLSFIRKKIVTHYFYNNQTFFFYQFMCFQLYGICHLFIKI